MQKFNKVAAQVVFNVLPISFNQDGSISATVTYGTATESPEIRDEAGNLVSGGVTINPIATNNYYFASDEALAIKNAACKKDETLDECLDRVITDALVKKGVLSV